MKTARRLFQLSCSRAHGTYSKKLNSAKILAPEVAEFEMLTAKLHFFTLDGQICLSPLGVLSRFPLTWIHQASIIFTSLLFFTPQTSSSSPAVPMQMSSFSTYLIPLFFYFRSNVNTRSRDTTNRSRPKHTRTQPQPQVDLHQGTSATPLKLVYLPLYLTAAAVIL